ncbi:MAG TPA: Zn-ribbon domain-containing OB-fold protein [Candidatus Bathyarchaeia archaeon]|nr:Zn-ribbon domain-containing OB-fold protein [Candidatus Bathyarchaeia archaeon]
MAKVENAENVNAVMVSRCTRCGTLYLPARSNCNHCYSSETVSEPLKSKSGRLLTYTVITAPPKSFEDKSPYTIGIIELDDGHKIEGWIEGIEADRLTVGMRLHLKLKHWPDGRVGFQLLEPD